MEVYLTAGRRFLAFLPGSGCPGPDEQEWLLPAVRGQLLLPLFSLLEERDLAMWPPGQRPARWYQERSRAEHRPSARLLTDDVNVCVMSRRRTVMRELVSREEHRAP